MSDASEIVVGRAALVTALMVMSRLVDTTKDTDQGVLQAHIDGERLMLYAMRQIDEHYIWSRLALPVQYQAGPSDQRFVLDREHLALIIGALRHDDTRDLWLQATYARLSLRGLVDIDASPPTLLEVTLVPASASLNDVAGMIGALARTDHVDMDHTAIAINALAAVVSAAKRTGATVRLQGLGGLPGRSRAVIVSAAYLTTVLEAGYESKVNVAEAVVDVTPSAPRWGDVKNALARDAARMREQAGKTQLQLLPRKEQE